MEKTIKQIKTFNYSKGACSLNFQLNTAEVSEFEDFKECLAEAIKDIDEYLNKENGK